MTRARSPALEAHILALPETAGSALYGMIDVLAATGTLWLELTGEEPGPRLIQPRTVSPSRRPFRCGNGIPIEPDLDLHAAMRPEIVILPELWLAPNDDLSERHQEVKEWICACYRAGAYIYSACSGSVLLAATGLLDGREATSHWGYEDLFRRRFPAIRFNPKPNLVIADPAGRIVTAGGTTSWHDLALHIISRHCSPGEALRIAKVYLLKWHHEGQLPFASLVRRQPHADAVVRRAEAWLAANYRQANAVSAVVERFGAIDVAVVNAGVLRLARIDALGVEDLDLMLDVNIRGVILSIQAAVASMRDGGRVITIGSNSASGRTSVEGAVYAMTKAAVARLVQGLALDLAARRITVNNIQPGPTATDMTQAHLDALAELVPLGRVAQPMEIAGLVAYLTSPAAAHMTGASLTLDGGYAL